MPPGSRRGCARLSGPGRAVPRGETPPVERRKARVPVTRHAGTLIRCPGYPRHSALRSLILREKEMKAPPRAALIPGADESRLPGCLTTESEDVLSRPFGAWRPCVAPKQLDRDPPLHEPECAAKSDRKVLDGNNIRPVREPAKAPETKQACRLNAYGRQPDDEAHSARA
jgi:hypothetical protein